MNFKKASFICLALLMVLVIGIGQVSASDLDNNNATDTLTIDSESVDNVNQADEIDVQEVSSSEEQQPLAVATDDEVLSDYTPDANGIYVSPTGDDTQAGTYDSPYGTIQHAISQSTAGKTIYLAGGTYLISSSINIDKTLNFVGYDGTTPVIDAQNSCIILTAPMGTSGATNMEFSFTNVTFTHGKSTNGGVFCFGSKSSPYPYYGGKAYFTNCTFVENTAQYGGVFCSWYNGEMAEYNTDGDYINVYSCAFINNTATANNAGSVFHGSGMAAPTIKYCIAIGNKNPFVYTNNGRNYEIKDSFWQVNNPTSAMMNEGSMDWDNNAKLTIVSDVDQITTDEQAVFTAKLVRSNGADYGNNVLFANVPITFTVTSGSLSETYTTLVNKRAAVTFTPSASGEITVTATLGGQSVTKTITVVGLPLYVSADAVDGAGDGSLANPYSMQDAIDIVNNGGSEKIEMLEGNYTFDTAFVIANNVDIRPYKTGEVNIAAKNGFLSIMADKQVALTNVTVSGLSAYSAPVFKLASNSKLNILYSVIKDNKVTMGAAIIADVASGAALDIGYSLIHDNTATMFIQGMYGALFNNQGTITANNNWWGSNTVPSGDTLYIGNAPTIASWFILKQTQDKTVLRTEWTSTITTQLVKNDGSAVDGYLHDLTGTYATNTGTLSEESFILSEENGYKATVDISGATEAANVVTKLNSQSLTASYQYEVPMTEIFIAVDGDDDAGTGTIDAPFQSLGRALDIAKEAGCVIYLINGTYDAGVICRGITTGYDPYTIDLCNFTLTSYNGPVVIDRTNLYKVLKFGKNTNINVTNLTFINGINRYANYGAIESAGNLTIRDCLFTNGIGGGFAEYVTGTGSAHVYIYDSNFTNTCVYDEKYSDACVFITGEGATLYMNNCRFENNGFFRNFTDPDTHGGIIVYNPNHNEACLRVQKGVATVEDCYFYNNTGVSMIYDKGFVIAKESYFVATCMDPALKIVSYGKGYDVDGCYFINNTGGAIGVGSEQWIINNDMEIKNSFFYNNSAEKGGAIHLDKAGALIENCYFEGNTAVDGGAIYNSYADLLINHCEFANNSATNKGGSIFTTGDQDFIRIENNLFNGSQADMGGVIYSEGITTLFNNEMHNGIAVNGSYIYNANRIGNTYVIISENSTYDVYSGDKVTITARLSDDMANPITGGNIIFIINGTEYPVFAQEGTAELNYTFIDVATYYVDGNYSGNRRYITVAGGATYNVNPMPTSLNATDIIINVGEKGVTYITLTDYYGNAIANANITLKFNNEEKELLTNGSGVATYELATDALSAGIYDVSAEFKANATHVNSSIAYKVYIKGATTISITKIDGNMVISGILKDEYGNGIDNATIVYSIGNGENLTVKTTNGAFEIPNVTNGLINIAFEGNDVALGSSYSITLSNVASAVNPETAFDIPTTDGENATYSVNLPKDATGNFTVIVDGKVYETKELVNGSASITVSNLSAGAHNITISYSGDSNYSPIDKNTTLNVPEPVKPDVKPVIKLSGNKNINMLYTAGTKYTVRVTADNKAVAGAKVTFTVNGKKVTVKTDKKGYASVAINLPPRAKAYTVTASYAGKTVKNTVKVNSVIKAKNKKVKKSKKVNKIKVTLKKVNGKALAKKKLKLKIKGKTVKAKTNKKGKATFKLKKKVLKKLKAGKKYKYTVTFGKDKVTKKLKVKK